MAKYVKLVELLYRSTAVLFGLDSSTARLYDASVRGRDVRKERRYTTSRLTLRLNVIERTSVADFPDFPLVDAPGFGVGLCERDARSSLLDFSRSSLCLLNLPIPGR